MFVWLIVLSAYMHNASRHEWHVCWRVTTAKFLTNESRYDHIQHIMNPTVFVKSKWILQWESVMARCSEHCSIACCNLALQSFHTTVAFVTPCCHGNCIRSLRTLLLLNDSDCSHCRAMNNVLNSEGTQMQTIHHTTMRSYINPVENINLCF